MREIDRGFRAVVRTLRKEQEREARIDALTAMVKELADRLCQHTAGLALTVEYQETQPSNTSLIRKARALIGEEGK